MDGNFVDNSFESLIETASVLPVTYYEKQHDNKKPESSLKKYDKFSLRIKFNNKLDPNSVNLENAVLMSGRGRVKTAVRYDEKKQSIIVSPKNKYLRDTLYILKISGKIMSEKGKSLRRHRFVAFRQNGSTLNFYKGFTGMQGDAPDTLLIQNSVLLPLLFVISALVFVISYFANYKLGMGIGTGLVLVATLAAFIDSISDYGKSHKEYIYGAKLYNQRFYSDALECFELALHYNPDNIFAKRGLDAAIIKCSEAVDA